MFIFRYRRKLLLSFFAVETIPITKSREAIAVLFCPFSNAAIHIHEVRFCH